MNSHLVDRPKSSKEIKISTLDDAGLINRSLALVRTADPAPAPEGDDSLLSLRHSTLRTLTKQKLQSLLQRIRHRHALDSPWHTDKQLVEASLLVSQIVQYKPTRRIVVLAALRHPRRALSLLITLLRVPRLTVTVPARSLKVLGDILGDSAAIPLLGNEPISVLSLPENIDTYTVGRHRQAVRTKRTTALRGGCTARALPPGAARDEMNQILRQTLINGKSPETIAWPIGDTETHVGVIGEDCNGQQIVVAVARVFGQLAILEMFVRLSGSNDASNCHALVHLELLNELHRNNVRYLAVGGTLRLSTGLKYLQHLQGYVPTNLKLTS